MKARGELLENFVDSLREIGRRGRSFCADQEAAPVGCDGIRKRSSNVDADHIAHCQVILGATSFRAHSAASPFRSNNVLVYSRSGKRILAFPRDRGQIGSVQMNGLWKRPDERFVEKAVHFVIPSEARNPSWSFNQ
jgi:hypothetical protein